MGESLSNIAEEIKYSELSEINIPQLPISEIETHLTSFEFSENHSGSFLGGVFPIDILKNSSALIVFLLGLSLSTNQDLNKA